MFVFGCEQKYPENDRQHRHNEICQYDYNLRQMSQVHQDEVSYAFLHFCFDDLQSCLVKVVSLAIPPNSACHGLGCFFSLTFFFLLLSVESKHVVDHKKGQ
jgi:hypothetical protein